MSFPQEWRRNNNDNNDFNNFEIVDKIEEMKWRVNIYLPQDRSGGR